MRLLTRSVPIFQPPVGGRIDRGLGINRGLIAFWPFNEGGGLTAFDLTGQNPAALTAPTWVTSPYGRAMSFNGSSSIATVTHRSELNLVGTPFSISFWIYPHSTHQSMILKKYPTGAGGSQWAIYNDNGTLRFYDGSSFVSMGQSISNNVWTHILVVATSTTSITTYKNGVPGSAATISAITSGTNPLFFGQEAGSFFLDGRLSGIRVWTRSLRSDEAQLLKTKPWIGIAGPRRFIGLVPPPNDTSLAAAIAAAGVATGDLSTAIRLAAAISAQGTVAGDLTTAIRLAAALAAQATTTGDIATAIRFAAAITGSGLSTADLTTAIELAGALSGSGTAAADITTAIRLAAAIGASGVTSGDLTTAIVLQAIVQATGTAVAELESDTALFAAVLAQATAAGDLTTAIRLLANAAAAGSATADLATSIALAASADAETLETAELSTAITLAAAATADAAVSASLTTYLRLAAAIGGQASSEAALSTSIRLAAIAEAVATATARLLLRIPARHKVAATQATRTVEAETIMRAVDAVNEGE